MGASRRKRTKCQSGGELKAHEVIVPPSDDEIARD